MSKERHGNREAKKPKKDRPKTPATAATGKGAPVIAGKKVK